MRGGSEVEVVEVEEVDVDNEGEETETCEETTARKIRREGMDTKSTPFHGWA